MEHETCPFDFAYFQELETEISSDIIDELNNLEGFINNDSLPSSSYENVPTASVDSELRLKCGEVVMNSSGVFIFKCTLCKESSKEFIYLTDYQEHLNVKHSSETTRNGSNHIGDESWIEEMNKMEKLDYAKHSADWMEKIDKALQQDELENVDDSNETRIPQIDENNSSQANDVPTSAPSKISELKQLKRKKKRTPGHCEICNRTFNDLYNLRIHKMIHSGELPFQCEECGKRFRQYNKLKIHCITHTNKKPFVCDICAKGFRFRNYLSVHKRLHSGDKPYKCKFCDEYFHSLHTRRLHTKTHHSEAKTYTCSICLKVLTAQCYLTAHMKRHTNQRDFQCDRCEKRFFSMCQLKDHKLSHTNIKPYECQVCWTRFQRKSNYTQHLKIHSDVKSYVCHICNKAFAQNAGLYGHMKSHVKD